ARVCRFFDERMDAGQRLAYVHELMRGGMGDVESFLARIERVFATMGEADRATPDFRQAQAALAADAGARSRYLAHARGAGDALRARMIALAGAIGWLDASARAAEEAALAEAMLRRPRLGFTDVDLACRLNADGHLDAHGRQLAGAAGRSTAHAATLACLGD